MWIISKSRFRVFWEMPGHEAAQVPLSAWHRIVGDKAVAWNSFADVKATYATASIFGDCVIFNIGGNKYRLVTRIRYAPHHKVFILHVLTHAEYDRENWKDDCRCEAPDSLKQKSARARRRAAPQPGGANFKIRPGP